MFTAVYFLVLLKSVEMAEKQEFFKKSSLLLLKIIKMSAS